MNSRRRQPASHKIMPLGTIDRDTQLELVPDGSYLDARNLRVDGGAGAAVDAADGVQAQVEGNLRVGSTMPDGTITRGIFHDVGRNRVYYWLTLPSGVGQIYEYAVAEGRQRLLLSTPALTFPTDGGEERSVNSAAIVGGRFLVWATSVPHPDHFIGTGPRWLDLERSAGQGMTYQVYFWNDNYSGQYRMRLQRPGSSFPDNIYINVPRNLSREEALTLIRGRFVIGGLTVTAITKPGADGNPFFTLRLPEGFELTAGSSDPDGLVLVPTNLANYDDQAAARLLDLIRWPPRYAPQAEYRAEPSHAANDLADGTFQFRLRYEYHDGSLSAWGPISAVNTPADTAGLVDPALNTLRVSFSDPDLATVSLRTMVARVHVAVREGANGLFRMVEERSVHQLDREGHYLDFYNDKIYPVIPSDATGGTVDTQVFKLYDSVPRGVSSLETIMDEDGNALLVLAGCLEGGDAEDVSVEYSVRPENSGGGSATGEDCRITIRGRIGIRRTEAQQELVGGAYPERRYRSAFHDLAGSAPGFVVYLAGTDYYALSDNLSPTPTGYFEIKNVPRGVYTLRVASPRCRFDASAGERFNLSAAGRAYQTTSAAVVACAGGERPTERQLDLRGLQDGDILDLSTSSGYGEITIQDAWYDSEEDVERYAELQLTTDAGQNIPEHHVEWTQIYFKPTASGPRGGGGSDPRSGSNPRERFYHVADHNGLAWTMLSNPYVDDGYRFAPGPDAQLSLDNPCTTGDPEVLLVTPAGKLVNEGDFVADYRRRVTGRIVTASGDGVAGVVAVLAGEGRTATTGADGSFSILTFARGNRQSYGGPIPMPQSLTLRLANPADACFDVDFAGGGPIRRFDLDVCQDGGADYDRGDITHDFDTSSVGPGDPPGLVLKSGGRYRTGLVYEDRAGRKGEVVEGPEIYIPFHTEDGNGYVRRYVNFVIVGRPPAWATHYRLLRSPNGVYADFQQRRVVRSRYVRLLGPGQVPEVIGGDRQVPGQVATSERVTHLMLQLDGLSRADELLPAAEGQDVAVSVLFEGGDHGSIVTGQEGDRLRLILDAQGNTVTDSSITEADVAGYYVEPADEAEGREHSIYYLLVKINPALRQRPLVGGELIEVYSPRTLDLSQELLYETGNAFPILDAGSPARRHGTNGVAQPRADAPGTGYLTGGDVFWLQQGFYDVRQDLSYGRNVEVGNLSRKRSAAGFPQALGRPNPLPPGDPERYLYYQLRTSTTFLQVGRQVGINSFLSGDKQLVDQAYGPITKVVSLANRLVVICRHKVQPIYVAHEAVMDMSGNALIGRTDRLLNIAPEAASTFGSAHPHSVARTSGESLMAFDAERGVAWRHGGNGTVDISRGLREAFHSAPATAGVVAAYDPTYDEYLLNIYDPQLGQGVTYAMRYRREQRRGWTSSYDFSPDLMTGGVRDYLSIVNGELWLHNMPDSQTFYDEAIIPYLEVASSLGGPGSDKLFHQIRCVSSDGISAEVTVLNGALPQGGQASGQQLSILPEANFKRRGAVLEAPFLRQQNTVAFNDSLEALYRGPRLHGKVVWLKFTGPDMRFLSADLTFTPLGDTKP